MLRVIFLNCYKFFIFKNIQKNLQALYIKKAMITIVLKVKLGTFYLLYLFQINSHVLIIYSECSYIKKYKIFNIDLKLSLLNMKHETMVTRQPSHFYCEFICLMLKIGLYMKHLHLERSIVPRPFPP